MRPHIAAVYAFARSADDFADEPGIATRDRLRLLDYWQLRLARGDTPLRPDEKVSVPVDDDLIFSALANTMRAYLLPSSLFEDLLSAFRQDVTTARYGTWADVLDYCRRSANPIGRLVLRVAGSDDARTDAAADAVCTALQLTNFWQDLAVDWKNGRLYLPLEERDRAGAKDADLDAGRLSREWKSALRSAVERTRTLFEAGRPVCDAVSGRLQWELRVTWLGGARILDKLQAGDFDVFHNRPTLGVMDVPPLLWQATRWRSTA
jgi:phytoene synthase